MAAIDSKQRKNIFDEIFDNRDDEDELEVYLNEPPIKMSYNFNLLEYWLGRKATALQKMAIDILSIPASSTDVERIFSSAKLDDNRLRQSLEPELKGNLQVAKSWFKVEEMVKSENNS